MEKIVFLKIPKSQRQRVRYGTSLYAGMKKRDTVFHQNGSLIREKSIIASV